MSKKRISGTCLLLECLCFILIFYGCYPKYPRDQNQVCFKKHCFKVEVVYKQEDLRRGLQFRPSLGKNQGMLFIFSENHRQSFWMKDTFIPLDMIWLDYSRRVVDIVHQASACPQEPCLTYTPKKEALYVLEINAGEAKALGIKDGDQAMFDLINWN